MRDQGQPLSWGPKKNTNGGFRFGVHGICEKPLIYGYTNGCLAFYTAKLNEDDERPGKFRTDLEEFLSHVFGANVDNASHFLLQIGDWGKHCEELLDRIVGSTFLPHVPSRRDQCGKLIDSEVISQLRNELEAPVYVLEELLYEFADTSTTLSEEDLSVV